MRSLPPQRKPPVPSCVDKSRRDTLIKMLCLFLLIAFQQSLFMLSDDWDSATGCRAPDTMILNFTAEKAREIFVGCMSYHPATYVAYRVLDMFFPTVYLVIGLLVVYAVPMHPNYALIPALTCMADFFENPMLFKMTVLGVEYPDPYFVILQFLIPIKMLAGSALFFLLVYGFFKTMRYRNDDGSTD